VADSGVGPLFGPGLKNRDPAHWRDAWQIEHTLGKYIISDRPMSEAEWVAARADVIDVTPEKPDE
jgi:hypothetical protein